MQNRHSIKTKQEDPQILSANKNWNENAEKTPETRVSFEALSRLWARVGSP